MTGYQYRAEEIAEIIFLKNSSGTQIIFSLQQQFQESLNNIYSFETSKVSSIHIGRSSPGSPSFPFSSHESAPVWEELSAAKGLWCFFTPVYSKTREIYFTKQDPATKHLVSINSSGWISCFLILIKSFQKKLYVSRSERNKGRIFTWQQWNFSFAKKYVNEVSF